MIDQIPQLASELDQLRAMYETGGERPTKAAVERLALALECIGMADRLVEELFRRGHGPRRSTQSALVGLSSLIRVLIDVVATQALTLLRENRAELQQLRHDVAALLTDRRDGRDSLPRESDEADGGRR